MKSPRLPHAIFLAALAIGPGLVSQVSAQTTWVETAAGTTYNWTNNASWAPTAYPNAAGAVVNVNNNIVGAQTIALPAGNTTVGTLNYGDSDGSNAFTINLNTLVFQGANSGDTTFLNVSATGTVGNNINSSVVLGGSSPLTVTALGTQKLQFGNLDVSTNTLTLSTANTTASSIAITGTFTGTGAVIKNGTGNATVSGAATSYTGPVTINAGTFTVGGGATTAIGTTSFTVNGNTVSGITGGSTLVVGSNQTPNPSGRISDSAVITLNGGGFSYLASNGNGLTYETFSSLVVGNGNSNINLGTGGGTAPESEIRMTTLSRPGHGTVQVRGPLLGSAPGTSGSTRIIISTAPTLIGGGGAAGTKTMSVLPWAVGGTNANNENNDLVTYDGSNGLRQLAAGEYATTLTTGANDTQNYSIGNTTISSDTTINAFKLVNTNNKITINSGKTLTVTSGAAVFAGTTSGTSGTGTLNFGGNEGVLWATATNTVTLTTSIAGSGGITKAGTGAIVLSAAAGGSNYTGTTTISGGILRVGATDTLPTGTAVVLANTTVNSLATPFPSVTTALDLNGFNQTIGSLSGGGTFGGNVLLGSGNLTTGGSNASTSYDGIISGTGGVTKAGTGTFTVTGTHSYTGATAVSAGTMLVSGTGSINTTTGAIAVSASNAKLRYDSSAALTRDVTVTSGGTFAYNSSSNYSGTFTQTNGKLGGTNWNGTLSGLTIGANQTITPGNSPGTASTGDQTWAGGGSYVWELNNATGTAGADPGWDLLSLTGLLDITATSGSTFAINITSLTLGNVAGNAANFVDGNNYSWLIADGGSAITSFATNKFALNTGAFTNTFTGAFAIARGDTVIGGDNTQIYLTYTAVPEPATWALLAGAGAFLMVLRRRRG